MANKINVNFKLEIISKANDIMTWYDAREYCKKNGGRLPTVKELQILSTLQRQGETHTNYSGWFWSSSERSSYGAWSVGFGSGSSRDINKNYHCGVLCIGGDK